MVDLPAKLKPVADKLRGLKAKLGVSTYAVSVRVRASTGNDLGEGFSETITPLLSNGYAPLIRVLSQRDVVLSGGQYGDLDLEITITPSFTGGGYLFTSIDPTPDDDVVFTEVVYIVEGDGLPAGGSIFKKISTKVDPFSYKLTLRQTSARP